MTGYSPGDLTSMDKFSSYVKIWNKQRLRYLKILSLSLANPEMEISTKMKTILCPLLAMSPSRKHTTYLLLRQENTHYVQNETVLLCLRSGTGYYRLVFSGMKK
jgi:hypothetical protein